MQGHRSYEGHKVKLAFQNSSSLFNTPMKGPRTEAVSWHTQCPRLCHLLVKESWLFTFGSFPEI